MKIIAFHSELFLATFLIFAIAFNILFYIGHKRKWSFFYDHETKEWVFARRNSILYEMFGDPEKHVYRIFKVGTVICCILLIMLVVRIFS